MAGCEELESKILDQVAGALPEEESAAVQAHLAGCPRCQAWAASCREAVQLAALPEPSEVEQRLFAQLPGRARAAFRERAQRPAWGRSVAVGLLSAAALAAVLVAAGPRWRGHRAGPSLAAAAMVEQDPGPSELETWALSDPLEDPDEQVMVDDGSVDTDDVTDLDLDTESME
ncbi:MAG TPA: zf-HC2 domain-containing protein [Myxococcaceae bacterium]|nr:zf-HC2 domain-containing protein [Myxococcaceae bacterium]